LLAWSPSYKNEWDLGFPSKEQASDMKLGGLGGVFVSKQASSQINGFFSLIVELFVGWDWGGGCAGITVETMSRATNVGVPRLNQWATRYRPPYGVWKGVPVMPGGCGDSPWVLDKTQSGIALVRKLGELFTPMLHVQRNQREALSPLSVSVEKQSE